MSSAARKNSGAQQGGAAADAPAGGQRVDNEGAAAAAGPALFPAPAQQAQVLDIQSLLHIMQQQAAQQALFMQQHVAQQEKDRAAMLEHISALSSSSEERIAQLQLAMERDRAAAQFDTIARRPAVYANQAAAVAFAEFKASLLDLMGQQGSRDHMARAFTLLDILSRHPLKDQKSTTGRCFHCEQTGHYSSNCPAKKKGGGGAGGTGAAASN